MIAIHVCELTSCQSVPVCYTQITLSNNRTWVNGYLFFRLHLNINHSSHVFLRCKLSNSLPPLFIQYFLLRLHVQYIAQKTADKVFSSRYTVYNTGVCETVITVTRSKYGITVTLTASESALAPLRSSK